MRDASCEIWIHPGRYSGVPCIGGTRIPLDSVVGLAWVYGVETAMSDYDLTREGVLVACWYAGIYGDVDPYIGRSPGTARVRRDGRWIKRWRAWADQWQGAMWSGKWDEVPDPPSMAPAEGTET